MKKNIFLIKFYYRPEISYEDWILKVYVDDRNICEFTVDGRIEEDTGNLIFLSDWFKNNLKFILNKNDEFPLAVDGNSGIEIRKKAYAIGIKENKEIEWFEAVYEWSERHLWTFSGLEMIYPDVMFRRIENKIEISWDSRNKYKDNKNYKNPDNDPKGAWRSGDVRSPNYRSTLCFDIVAPNGNHIKPPTNGWRWSEKEVSKKISTGEIFFKDDFTGIVRKIYLCDQPGRTPENLWIGQRFGTTRTAAAMIKKLFDGIQVFDTPKPCELIEAMLQLASNKDSIILDFFSGSATTAHAVMQLNAEDGGHRKFIMVQLPEITDEKSEAYKAGFKNICEIGKERIRRAGKKIIEAHPEVADNLDIGFRVLKLDDSNMNDVYYNPSEYSQDLLSRMESNVKTDRTDLDLLFGCLLEWGLPLSLSYSSEKIEECTVHNYNDGDLIACFDEKIPDSVIKEMAKQKPLRAVFRDSSFADSPSKINVGEIFKLLSPDTRVKVI